MGSMFPMLMQGKEMNGGDITSFIVITIILVIVGVCIYSIINESK